LGDNGDPKIGEKIEEMNETLRKKERERLIDHKEMMNLKVKRQ